jgi:hypothetical protein
MKFIKRYYWFILLVLGLAVIGCFFYRCVDNVHEARVQYIKEHPEVRYKDGNSIQVLKDGRLILATPCGECVSSYTDDTAKMMSIYYSKACKFNHTDEQINIPMERGSIYSIKKNDCKIK